nr:MAG TPA: hypothetical protein [Caudoviricetes sp.]
MLKIESDGTISLNRGDTGTITVTANNEEYEFQPEDVILLRIFEKKGYTKEPLLEKTLTILNITTEADIFLVEEDTLFCPENNKATTYWYSISLNEDVILGYDEDGAKQFIVYPAKVRGDDNNG